MDFSFFIFWALPLYTFSKHTFIIISVFQQQSLCSLRTLLFFSSPRLYSFLPPSSNYFSNISHLALSPVVTIEAKYYQRYDILYHNGLKLVHIFAQIFLLCINILWGPSVLVLVTLQCIVIITDMHFPHSVFARTSLDYEKRRSKRENVAKKVAEHNRQEALIRNYALGQCSIQAPAIAIWIIFTHCGLCIEIVS